MKRIVRERGLDVPPPGVAKHVLCLERNVNQGRSLRNHLPRAQGVVPDFGVPHVRIGGQANGRTVRLDGAIERLTFRLERVHRRRLGDVHGVVLVLVFILSPTVEDAHQDGLLLRDCRVRMKLHDRSPSSSSARDEVRRHAPRA